jgi:DNA-binding CsgD family transcriptional regulator/tetratricopeptide (TPR) repeat protein
VHDHLHARGAIALPTNAQFATVLGRGPELEFLLASFRRAKADSAGARLLVAGESGVGKTRLLLEFERLVRRERCLVLRGACVEYLSTPYEPFIEALLDDERSTSLERELRGTAGEAASDVELERLRRFRLVEDYLRRRANAVGSLVLVIEDVHWSDAATFELWRYLGRRLSDAPVLMIATYRSDELALDPTRSAQLARALREGASELSLQPLGDRDVTALVREAAGDAPIGQVEIQRIVELAEGKPLVAEELLLGALQRGTAGATTPVVSIRATLLERLRKIPEAEQQALLTAAVLGREFRAELLAELTGTGAEAILGALRRARNLQLIVEDPASGAFRFRHAITREVFYRELLTGEVRVLHRRIAERLEAGEGGDEAAYHWWAAGDADRAVAANEAAGDRAGAIFAYADAARFYERALSVAEGGARHRLVEKTAYAFCAVGEMVRAREWCQDGAGALRRSGDAAAAQTMMLWVARQLYESGEVERSLETIAAVREEQRGTAATPVHYTAAMTLAGILSTLGRAAETLSVLDEAEALDCEREEFDGFRAHNARGNALCSLGDYAGAGAEYDAALAVAERLDNAELQVHALSNAANAALLSGRDAEAARVCSAALELARGRGLHRQAATLESAAALAALFAGDLEAALRAFRSVVSARSIVAMTLGFAGAIGLRLRGLLDGVADLDALDADAALENALHLRESQVIAIVAGAAARSALDVGERERAATLVRRALPALNEPDHAYWLCEAAADVLDEAESAPARALLQRACGFPGNAAADAYLRSFEARAAMRRDPAAGKSAALATGQAFLDLGRPIDAAAAFELGGAIERARSLYAAAGATRAVRRLEGAKAAPAGSAAPSATLPVATELTRREREVAEFAARGYANRLIAAELGIGERTVETHLAVVYRKLGVKSRTELAALLSPTS